MTARPRAIAVVILLPALVPAVRAQSVEYKKPEVHLKGVAVDGVDWSKRTAETKLAIEVENTGPAFKLKDLSYRLKLNDKQTGEGKYEQQIAVPAGSSITFDLPCTVDLSAVPGIAWGIVAGGFELHYELETEFTLPIFPPFNPRIKTAIDGDLSLASTVQGWTAKIKDRISKE
ncbi:MAG TPA: LEA type 2 family protein [Blastocatellia bacterium]|nr:LEA type 2 family protein [Blastocatellia bacterium]